MLCSTLVQELILGYHNDIFTERFWRRVKYEEVYLRDYTSVEDARHILRIISHSTTTSGLIKPKGSARQMKSISGLLKDKEAA
jgi:hypothetical protein